MERGDSLHNLVNKLSDAEVFLEVLRPFAGDFDRARDILELGAGEGWASCIVKRLRPEATVMASDISCHALAGLPTWRRVFHAPVDRAFACRSYAIPVRDASQDLVFAFAAAHHFRAHRRTMIEIARVLRPGGRGLFLHEPTCPPALYPLAYRRVNLKRPDVPEDVLVMKRIARLARDAGLRCEAVFDLSIVKRGPIELLYYSALRRLPFLKHLLPCTRHILLEKPAVSTAGAPARAY